MSFKVIQNVLKFFVYDKCIKYILIWLNNKYYNSKLLNELKYANKE